MCIWIYWYEIVKELRPAFRRQQTFMWFLVVLIGISIRSDLFGVTSIIRSVGLESCYYKRLLAFFHSTAVDLKYLTVLWTKIILKYFPNPIEFNGRPILVGDGIKVAKSGKKMPGVKSLHQESESNSKPEYIMGHSFQAIGILYGSAKNVFSIPLVSRIHEGIKFTPKDKKTLLDKMIVLLSELQISTPYYFVADAYYASKNMILPLLEAGNHLITRVRSNGVAYYPPTEEMQPKGKGRKKTYGEKTSLKNLLTKDELFINETSPVYGEEKVIIKYLSINLLWRPVGRLVRFVIVKHPNRGNIFLLSTDLELSPIDIIKIYGYRFKIEVSFKQILHTIGGYSYRFWMQKMAPTKRYSGDTFLHKKTEKYRDLVKKKINAYHLYVQVSIISQGLMMYLAVKCPLLVWSKFGSWMRTMKTDSYPSEFVVATALKNTFFEFLFSSNICSNLKKFIVEKLDYDRVNLFEKVS